MLEYHRRFIKMEVLITLFMAKLAVLEAQQCHLKRFKNVTNGNQALPRSNIISRHNLGRLGECHILCTQRENCHGYNFRFRPSNNFPINCQLSNSTEKWNSSKIKYGPWVYYQDVVITEDIDECFLKIDECHTNANCSNTFGSYKCQCKYGYTGNGKTCKDIDECAQNSHTCDINANCKNTVGSYDCQCHQGYSGNGNTCTDIDECAQNSYTCDVNANCKNTDGSYSCQCHQGYSGNGKTCTDIDECAQNSHTCDVNANCKNTVGSYDCQCRQEYGNTWTECSGYTWLNESNRNQNYSGSNVKCDDSLSPGWYRFGGGAGIKMPTSCTPENRCGTHATGWINGTHPTIAQCKVTRKVCYSWSSNCCLWSNNIKVVNCGLYYVYKLSVPPSCRLRYCGSDN